MAHAVPPNRDPGLQGGRRTGHADDIERHAMTSTQNADPSVVLVHGAYADGSSWSEVIRLLHAAGITATAVQNPLTSLADDVTHTRRVLAQQPGPVILAGHSFGGTVISEAGTHPAVAALVYVAARAPEAGEDYGALAGRFPVPAGQRRTGLR